MVTATDWTKDRETVRTTLRIESTPEAYFFVRLTAEGKRQVLVRWPSGAESILVTEP